MFHSVGRIMRWAKNYRKRMILGFVCSFFATWCTCLLYTSDAADEL